MSIDIRGRGTSIFLCLLVPLGSIGHALGAQEVAEYFDQSSPMPPLVGSRAATLAFDVYNSRFEGPDFINPAYRASISELADRFSPIMKHNNGSVPQEVIASLSRGDAGAPLLHIDAWNFAGHDPERTRSWSLDLRERATMDSVWALTSVARANDRGRGHISPDADTTLIMYLDFPGKNPEEWRRIHIESEGIESHAYVHFFLFDERPFRQLAPAPRVSLNGCTTGPGFRPTTEARYAPVLQYWFFYPFNDGVNNHEGDWEHLNVVLSTESALENSGGLLTAREVCGLLTGRQATTADEPKIREVDYYFHHSVFTLDYTDAYKPVEERALSFSQVSESRPQWVGQDWLQDRLAARIEKLDEHGVQKPIVYVGGNSVGLDVLINPPGRRDRNPHGSYPFPGVWKHVGPLGSSERMYGNQSELNSTLERLAASDGCPTRTPRDPFVCFDSSTLTLLPDWEVYNSAEAAWQHFWMVLPLRWGYPVTESPGGGVVAGLNVGQEAPVGPSRSTGWNKTGPSRGFGPYQAHALPRTFQTGAQEGFGPSLGFLNWSDLALALPPINPLRLLGQHIVGAVDEDWRQFNPKENLPARHQTPLFLTRGQTWLSIRWVNALPIRPTDGDVFSIPSNAVEAGTSWSAGVASHYGRLGSETTFLQSKNSLTATTQSTGGIGFTNLSGELRFRELHSDLRWSLFHGPFQPFLSLGYGWAWTRLAQAGSDAITAGPGWWPNSKSLGLGAEVFVLQRTEASVSRSNFDISFRVDLGRTWQDIPILWGSSDDVRVRARDGNFDLGLTRDQVRLGLAFSF